MRTSYSRFRTKPQAPKTTEEQIYYKVFYGSANASARRYYFDGFIKRKGVYQTLYDKQRKPLFQDHQKQEQAILQTQYKFAYHFIIIYLKQISPAQFYQKQANTITKYLIKEESTYLKYGLFVQNQLYHKLKHHQIQGVQFMYNCIMGYKSPFQQKCIQGCILADSIGLGKTLQTITLIYSLIKMEKIYKCIVVSPVKKIETWQKQCKKWLNSKLTPMIAFGDCYQVQQNICKQFTENQQPMLVLSYEGFYRFIDLLDGECDLIVFDQGQRLKYEDIDFYKKVINFSTRKRVLLTGAPNIQETYTCISIVNPGMYLTQPLFNKAFKKPILNGKVKKEIQVTAAINLIKQQARKMKQYSLRRTIDTLQKYLPIKNQYFVLFKPTPLQKLWYDRLLKRKQSESDVLSLLNLFRKLFIHPQIFKNDVLNSKFDSALFIEDLTDEISYKINFVLNMCRDSISKKQKVVVVSYFTSTFDFLEKILESNQISFVKLDSQVDNKDRQTVINHFDKYKSVLLLQGKAIQSELSLVSAKTMIILEPDWNPLNDIRAISNIWKKGQTQEVAIYRLMIIQSFEQKIIERHQLKNSFHNGLIDINRFNKLVFDYMDMKQFLVPLPQKNSCFNQNKIFTDKMYQINFNIEPQSMGIVYVARKKNRSSQKQKQQKYLKITNQFADGILLFESLLWQSKLLRQNQNCNLDDKDQQKVQQKFKIESQEIKRIFVFEEFYQYDSQKFSRYQCILQQNGSQIPVYVKNNKPINERGRRSKNYKGAGRKSKTNEFEDKKEEVQEKGMEQKTQQHLQL